MKTILKALRSMTRVASIEREAAALQRATDMEAKAARWADRAAAYAGEANLLRGALDDLVRGIGTAPLSRYITEAQLPAFRGDTGTYVVPSAHLAWDPLSRALAEANVALARPAPAPHADTDCGRPHPGPCAMVGGMCLQPEGRRG